MKLQICLMVFVFNVCYGQIIPEGVKDLESLIDDFTTKELVTMEPVNLLASPQDCQKKILFDGYTYGGTPADIYDYQWMSLLEYETSNGTYSLKCAGSLISHRYILTAAHCVSGQILTKVGKLVRVRLGEYDTSTDIDCANGKCIDSAKYVTVDKIIVHEHYDGADKNRLNDIALVRLSKEVYYTSSITPICLPSVTGFSGSLPGDTVIVAGWGRTLTARRSDIKIELNVKIFNHDECIEKYGKNRVNITDMQICAGGIYKEDTCDGDSGGPLMLTYNSYWTLEGIVSFGRGCGLEGWPGIYTRVSKYEDWIRQNIEP